MAENDQLKKTPERSNSFYEIKAKETPIHKLPLFFHFEPVEEKAF